MEAGGHQLLLESVGLRPGPVRSEPGALGTQCSWDPWDSGPPQCDPNTGRWKLNGPECYWDPWDSGPAQCHPNLTRTFDNAISQSSVEPRLTFLYFTCSYWATHSDDYGPLSVSVRVEALDPSGRVLASETGSDGSGFLRINLVATVPLSELSSGSYSCRSTPIVPAEAERVTEMKLACGDERNDILREYGEHQVPTIPKCEDFSRTGGTAHFSWTDWTQGAGGHAGGWAIGKIWAQLENWYAEYGRGGFRVTSGYRCPHVNASLPDHAVDSRHMSGEAIDVYSRDHVWTLEEFTTMQLAAIRAGSTWQSGWNTYTDHHLHAQWR